MVDPDIAPLIKVHSSAFSAYMNTRLGSRYVGAFLRWFKEAPEGIALTGKVDGKVVGYVVGAPVGYQVRLNRDLAAVVALALLRRPWLLVRRDIVGALANRVRTLWDRGSGNERTPEGCPASIMSLVGIGVLPSARGQGVGAALMSAFEKASREGGADGMRLSVYRDNQPARRLYEKDGWVAEDTQAGRAIYYRKWFLEADAG